MTFKEDKSTHILNKILGDAQEETVNEFIEWLKAHKKKNLGWGHEITIAEVCLYYYNQKADDKAIIKYIKKDKDKND